MNAHPATSSFRLILAVGAVTLLVACHPLLTPVDRSLPSEAALPDVTQWESVAEHGEGNVLSLVITDASPGDADYFVEPRAPSHFFIVIQFSEPVTEAQFREASIVVARNEGGVFSFSSVTPEFIDEESGAIYIRAVTPADPVSIAIRIFGPDGDLVSERSFAVIPGDVNGDGTVNADDNTVGPVGLDGSSADASEMATRADMDADGTVESGDDGTVVTTNDGDMSPGDPPNFDDPTTPTATLSFDANGPGVIGTIDGITAPIGSTVTLPDGSAYTYSGHAFDGWNTASDGSGTFYLPGADLVGLSASITLYAQWIPVPTYTITYDANGSSGSAPVDSNAYAAGAAITIAGQGGLTNGILNFAAWNEASDGSGTPWAAGSATMPARNLLLYAQWSSVPVYNVTYDPNGGTGAPTDGTPYPDGATVTVAAPGAMDRTGFLFLNWNTVVDGGGTTYDPSDVFTMPAADVTLYAQWEELYQVTYDANLGTGSPPTDTTYYQSGGTVTVAGQGLMIRSGHGFDGWNTAADGSGTTYDPADILVMPAANLTLYARWDPLYTITYDANGATSGSAPVDSSLYESGELTTLATNSGGLAQTNFVFSGWNTASDGSGLDYAAGFPYTMPSTDVTFYARWRLDVSGGGLGTPGDPYSLRNADDLDMVRYALDAHYSVDASIDLGVAPYNSGDGGIPIGNDSDPFTGTFNGGYDELNPIVIENLFINRSYGSADRTGLFGSTFDATIQRVALENVDIRSGDRVGALVGLADGGTEIIESYVTGTMSVERWSGGLVGGLSGGSAVIESFAEMVIVGNDRVGGLVGQVVGSSSIVDSYTVGTLSVTGDGGGIAAQVGVGTTIARTYTSMLSVNGSDALADVVDGTLSESYFDIESTGSTSSSGTGLSTGDMMIDSSYTAWDFGGVWGINNGASYPYHAWYGGAVPAPPAPFVGGNGLPGDPFLINSIEGLLAINRFPNSEFELTENISMAELPWSVGRGWEPIGSTSVPFRGELLGSGFEISDLYIDAETDNVGLFEVVDGATISTLHLYDVDVSTSGSRAGGVAGYSTGSTTSISASFVAGAVAADGPAVGGLVGEAENIAVIQSFADVAVSSAHAGESRVGGLIGHHHAGGIENSYAVGTATGNDVVGGLVGRTSATILHSFASVVIASSGGSAGGAVGERFGVPGAIAGTFYDLTVSGSVDTSDPEKGQALSTPDMQDQATYIGAGWLLDGFRWDIQNGVTYPYLGWQPNGVGTRP